MLSIESESEEVAASDPFPRVLFTESPLTKVSTNSSPTDLTEPSLRRELPEDAETSESSTHTGLAKTEPSSSSRSSWLTPTIKPSPETPESTGLPLTNTSAENQEVSPPLERSTEVFLPVVTRLTRTDPLRSRAGSEETEFLSGDSVDQIEQMHVCFG